MNHIDWTIIGLAAVGWAIWTRGCWKKSAGDCWLGLAVGVAATALYFFLFTLSRTPWLGALVIGAFLVVLLPFGRSLKNRSIQILAVVTAILAVAAAALEFKIVSMGNSLLVIEPYRVGRGWAFDEPRLGLRREPFVEGIPEMIDQLVAKIPEADKGVRLIFSQREFPGAQLKLDWRREAGGGNWYHSAQLNSDGWLCPALFKFFPRAPQHIYVKAEAK